MNKTRSIGLALALGAGLLVAGAEYLREIYFVRPSQEAARQWPAARHIGSLMQRIEWFWDDARFGWRGPRAPHPDIAVIAIGDEDLREIGQWPWSRAQHARLIRALEKAPPKALLFDIFFIEPSTQDPRGDRELIRATRDNPWVVHSLFFRMQGERVLDLERPMPALAEVLSSVGYANAVIDEDGTLRRAIPDLRVDDQPMTLLSVVGYNFFNGHAWNTPAYGVARDRRGRMRVDFAGPAWHFPYYHFRDVVAGRVPADKLAGKVVLFGSTSTGAFDHYPTPTSEFMPGLEFHANVVDNLLRGRALREAPIGWTYSAIALIALFVGLCLARLSPVTGALFASVMAVMVLGLGYGLFARRGLLVDLGGPLLTLALGYGVVLVHRFFSEEREKRWVKAAFGQYVSPKVLDILIADPNKLKLVGERRDITAFFSDVAGFTSISERMNPDELVVLLNRYLSAMTEIVFQYDGYLNKYMGDGIMAFWNAPLKQADHASRACRCALKSKLRLARLNDEFKAEGIAPLSARIGINTGLMTVGNMGSRQKSDYTVMGDHVNLASRLEGANKPFGSAIMISEFTYEIVNGEFEVRYLDRLRVPGKAKPVKTYELLAEKGRLSPEWAQALPVYHEGIHLLNDRQFGPAKEKFLEVRRIVGQDKACELYLARAQEFERQPPAKDWDGVYDVKTK